MSIFVLGWLIALWIFWIVPVFILRVRSKAVRRSRTDHFSLVGMLLQVAAYPIAAVAIDPASFSSWRLTLSVLFGIAALLSMWSAIPALGKQWRLAAGVNEGHELVQSGPYGIVRHPIYTSMLALLLATALLFTPWLRIGIAVVIFWIGTQIRIRAEERILAVHFGKTFEDYRMRVPAMVPGLW